MGPEDQKNWEKFAEEWIDFSNSLFAGLGI